MKIFTDLHHSDLYFSLKRLFEDRLGHELYRPIGLEWFHNGFWKIAQPYGNAMDTVNQYLSLNEKAWDQYKSLNGGTNNYAKNNIYHIYEPVHDYHQKAITFDQFRSIKFDIILPTVALHDKCYEDLRNKFQPDAKIIAHLGNTGQKTHLPNVITSVPYNTKPHQYVVYVHQELDPNLYQLVPPNLDTKNIYNVANLYPYPQLYNTYKEKLIEANFKSYGSGCPDGSLFGSKGVAEKMVEANIGWHLKPLGGLGHSAMGWLYCGRPVVTNMSQHRSWGGNAMALFEPGVTCHDIEAHTVEENCKAIKKMLKPEEQMKWHERTAKRCRDIINYDTEAEQARLFLESLR